MLHPQSASKTPPKKKKRRAVAGGKNLAASLCPWECDVYDFTDSVLLLTTRKDPTVIVKLQSDPRIKHVADDMANEAAIFEALREMKPSKRWFLVFVGTALILAWL